MTDGRRTEFIPPFSAPSCLLSQTRRCTEGVDERLLVLILHLPHPPFFTPPSPLPRFGSPSCRLSPRIASDLLLCSPSSVSLSVRPPLPRGLCFIPPSSLPSSLIPPPPSLIWPGFIFFSSFLAPPDPDVLLPFLFLFLMTSFSAIPPAFACVQHFSPAPLCFIFTTQLKRGIRRRRPFMHPLLTDAAAERNVETFVAEHLPKSRPLLLFLPPFCFDTFHRHSSLNLNYVCHRGAIPKPICAPPFFFWFFKLTFILVNSLLLLLSASCVLVSSVSCGTYRLSTGISFDVFLRYLLEQTLSTSILSSV